MTKINQELSKLAKDRVRLESMALTAIDMLNLAERGRDNAYATATMAKDFNRPNTEEYRLLAESSNGTYDTALKLKDSIQEDLNNVLEAEALLKKTLVQKEIDRKNLDRYSNYVKTDTTFLGVMYNKYNGAVEFDMGILGTDGFGPDRFVVVKNKKNLDGFIATLTEMSNKMESEKA